MHDGHNGRQFLETMTSWNGRPDINCSAWSKVRKFMKANRNWNNVGVLHFIVKMSSVSNECIHLHVVQIDDVGPARKGNNKCQPGLNG